MLTYVFRVDASVNMGSGHVMRCLTLADDLHNSTIKVVFICRELPGNMCSFIEKKGYEVYRLPYNVEKINDEVDEKKIWIGETWQRDAEQTSQILKKMSATMTIHWLIIDHYNLDIQWEQGMKTYVRRIMVIDDLADRHHDCDLLLDQNLYIDMETRYDGLLPEGCQRLLGAKYALLRKEFYQARGLLKERDGIVRRVLVFFGGSDPTTETMKTLEALKQLNRKDISIDIVVGSINPYKAEIQQICMAMTNWTYHCQVNNIAELMISADLAIGAGGSAIWERCFLGLPTINIIIAENQFATVSAVAKVGAIYNLGWYNEVDIKKIHQTLLEFTKDPNILRQISIKSQELFGHKLLEINNFSITKYLK